MKIAKAIAILLLGPLLGILFAFVFGALSLPTQALDGGRAPGDGFLIMAYILLSFLISIPLSIWLAGVVLFRASWAPKSNGTEVSTQRV
ncbi:MAG TPA: hypothetical protein VNY29_18495 [Terriglobales bacterium]|nr:hypothetical protein [Terriglobales bacterium]